MLDISAAAVGCGHLLPRRPRCRTLVSIGSSRHNVARNTSVARVVLSICHTCLVREGSIQILSGSLLLLA